MDLADYHGSADRCKFDRSRISPKLLILYICLVSFCKDHFEQLLCVGILLVDYASL